MNKADLNAKTSEYNFAKSKNHKMQKMQKAQLLHQTGRKEKAKKCIYSAKFDAYLRLNQLKICYFQVCFKIRFN